MYGFRQDKNLAFQTGTPSEVLTDTRPKATSGDYPVEGNDSMGLFIYAEKKYSNVLKGKRVRGYELDSYGLGKVSVKAPVNQRFKKKKHRDFLTRSVIISVFRRPLTPRN